MAEDLVPDALVPPPRAPEHASVFRGRFAVAYLALAVLAGVGIGGAVVLLDRPAPDPVVWSAWQPAGSQATFDDQIARYVSGRYRNGAGNPLVAVIPGLPSVTSGEQRVAVSNVVIQDDPEGDRDGFRVVDIERSWMYQLCGLGVECSMLEGGGSPEQMQILRREALELALYTFKYGDDIDTVIALLPPNLGDADDPQDDEEVALFFEKSALGLELSEPLHRTLLAKSLPQGAELDPRDSLVIERLTANRLFLYQFQPLQAGSALMHLLRPAAAVQ